MSTVKYNPFFIPIAVLTILLLAGCAPVISREVLKEVDKGVSFEQLSEEPEAYKGRTLLLGGDVIETQNLPDKTLIFVLQRPLGFRGRPAAGDVSKGRFIVTVPGFLDPAIYSHGRKVTVAGTVVGKEVRPLGEIDYTYLIVEKRELYLWPEEKSSSAEPRVHFGVGVVF
ncbi:MAG: Slp family lipoprotein [Deltaproteobacteria bacterium]|nr:Slp family lipoprotein [Deltaproteobacteria bacterium]